MHWLCMDEILECGKFHSLPSFDIKTKEAIKADFTQTNNYFFNGRSTSNNCSNSDTNTICRLESIQILNFRLLGIQTNVRDAGGRGARGHVPPKFWDIS